ncbi:Hypothetical predicted protein [Pelobates cultripes]|uniref:Uncharacterized protein n=1 Tax=Pelobates cultripes TaxID=61616 RepID=A0AAD1VR19_PELCU|nr:Hypothetical predicted protein [Pelobates cultripes]
MVDALNPEKNRQTVCRLLALAHLSQGSSGGDSKGLPCLSQFGKVHLHLILAVPSSWLIPRLHQPRKLQYQPRKRIVDRCPARYSRGVPSPIVQASARSYTKRIPQSPLSRLSCSLWPGSSSQSKRITHWQVQCRHSAGNLPLHLNIMGHCHRWQKPKVLTLTLRTHPDKLQCIA